MNKKEEMSVPPQVVEHLEKRARTAEEIMNFLENEIKQLTVTQILSDLKAENESLKGEVASLIHQLEVLERANELQQVPASGNQHMLQGNLAVIKQSKTATKNNTVVPAEKNLSVNKGPKVKNAEKQKDEKNSTVRKPKGEKIQKADRNEYQSVDVGKLDFRVGKIVNVKKHPDADSLYVEEIELGEERPRTVVSGLVKHVPLEEMQNRMVVVLCNLKPAKMRGVTSEGMVMCACTPEKIEVLVPPDMCVPGDEVVVEGYTRNPEAVLNPKKKIFETVAVDLKTNDAKIASYKGVPLSVAGKGVITVPSLINVCIK